VTLAAISRERQIERAWAIVEPDRGAAKVPIRARRAVVAFKASIAGDADALKKAYSSPAFRRLMADFTKPGTLGRDQRLAPIREALAPAAVERAGSAILVTWITPHASLKVIDPQFASFAQAGCVVSTAYVSRRGARPFPVIEISDHCLGRAFQRAPGIDMRAAFVGASRAYLDADWADVEAAWREIRTVYLRGRPGVFLATPIAGPDRNWLIGRCSTWISTESAGADQVPIAAAVDPSRSVLAAAVGGDERGEPS
jgi:hypothetical protein